MKSHHLFHRMKRLSWVVLPAFFGACASEEDVPELDYEPAVSFEEFEAATPRVSGDTDLYLVEGDMIFDIDELWTYWSRTYGGYRLSLENVNNVDDVIPSPDRNNITYCVSNNFGTAKQSVVDALRRASDFGWEALAGVNFVYANNPMDDQNNCTGSNASVYFNVFPDSLGGCAANVGHNPLAPRSLRCGPGVVGSQSFVGDNFVGLIGHELGHILGFVHEHGRIENGGTCLEGNLRTVTSFDLASIMHYNPGCNGMNASNEWSVLDSLGAAWNVYGSPFVAPLPKVGIVGTNNTPWAREVGDLADHSWTLVNGASTSKLILDRDRMGLLTTTGTALVKEGATADGGWQQVWSGPGTVISLSLSGTRIGIVTSNNVARVREGAIGSTGWIDIASDAKAIALADNRIGIIRNSDGKVRVTKGPLATSGYVWAGPLRGGGVDLVASKIVMKGSRIGIQTTAGTLWTASAFVEVNGIPVDDSNPPPLYRPTSANAVDFDLTIDRIGIITSDGHVWAKEGFQTAQDIGWVELSTLVGTKIALAGDRIAFVESGTNKLRAKEGALGSPWVQMTTLGVAHVSLTDYTPTRQVFNLSQGSPASHNVADFSPTFPASRAVDGDTRGDFSISPGNHTVQANNPAWTVDLGGIKTINRVDVWNRTDCPATCPNRLKEWSVSVSDDGIFWTQIFRDSVDYGNPLPGDQSGLPQMAPPFVSVSESFENNGAHNPPDRYNNGNCSTSSPGQRGLCVPLPVKGRYVRVQINRPNEYLHLAEVRVWGN